MQKQNVVRWQVELRRLIDYLVDYYYYYLVYLVYYYYYLVYYYLLVYYYYVSSPPPQPSSQSKPASSLRKRLLAREFLSIAKAMEKAMSCSATF